MSEKQETVEQAAERLGLKLHRSVNYPREAGVTVERVDAAPAIEIIQSLEADVAKLKWRLSKLRGEKDEWKALTGKQAAILEDLDAENAKLKAERDEALAGPNYCEYHEPRFHRPDTRCIDCEIEKRDNEIAKYQGGRR